MRASLTLAVLASLVPMASAQLALFTFDGTTETPVGATYNYGSVSAGSSKTVRFRVHDTSTTCVTISPPTVAGAGFPPAAVNGSPPYTIPPYPSSLNFIEFTIQFSGAVTGNYSANLLVTGVSAANCNGANANPISVLLLATVLPATAVPTIAFVSGCTNSSSGVVAFPVVQMGANDRCIFTLQNTGTQQLPISLAVTGNAAFQGPQGVQPPLNVGETRKFMIVFTPVCGTAIYSGSPTGASFAINGQAFALTGNGITPQLGTPALTFDTGVFASGQQRTLTLSLPTVAPCGATGTLNLAFAPSAQGVEGDNSVVFLQGSVRNQTF
jgi:hypothetical protein